MVKTQKGFTLIELMIVIAIIGILAAVAVPQYSQYTKRAKFTEVISKTIAAKTAVTMCYQEEGDIAVCDSKTNGIPEDITGGTGIVKSVTTLDGQITAVGGTAVDSKEYKLKSVVTGSAVSNNLRIEWSVDSTSSCILATLCKE